MLTASVICISASAADTVFAYTGSSRGDVNSDNIIDAADASMILNYYAEACSGTELGLTDEQFNTADADGDGCLDAADASLILSYYAHIMNEEYCTLEQFTSPAAVSAAHIDSPYCRAAALKCLDSGELLYSDNINERIAPASLTKLLTASVALHYLSPDTVVTVGSELSLVKPYSSLCLISPGHRLKLYDLLTGMLMASGNDAAYTVAVTTARAVSPDGNNMSDREAVSYFTGLMNDYAASIGMKNSHFTSPEGWDDEGQYTTVSDLLTLAGHAFSIPEIRTITGTYQKKVYFVSGENITWTNTNALLNPNSRYYRSDAAGIKTGTTENAGYCLISAFVQNGKTYISAVTGCNSDNDRYELTLKMLDASADDHDSISEKKTASPGGLPGAVFTQLNVSFDEAKEKFAHPIILCTEDDFTGYNAGIVSQNGDTGSDKAFCLSVTYRFTDGSITLTDRSRLNGINCPSGDTIEYRGRTFYVEDIWGETHIGYYPALEKGIAYQALFSPEHDIYDIMDMMIAVEINGQNEAASAPSEEKPADDADKTAVFERLRDLNYIPITCDGLPDYLLTADDGTVYLLNFDGKWVWKKGIDAEAVLPDDIISWLMDNKDSIGLVPTEYCKRKNNEF